MPQRNSMALSGKQNARVAVDWVLAYTYFLLCVGAYAAYRDAPTALVVGIGGALALPHLLGRDHRNSSTAEKIAKVAVTLIFASLAHSVGRGIAAIF